jgi:hypothetical protein
LLADEVRFELTEALRLRQFSRLVQSTALPLIHPQRANCPWFAFALLIENRGAV